MATEAGHAIALPQWSMLVKVGAEAFAPRGRAHGFSNPSCQPASYLAMLTPSGYEQYFERVANHFQRTGALPDAATTEEWMSAAGTRQATPI